MKIFFQLKNIFNFNKSEDKAFRYDISFLRVIAVAAVVLYHFNVFPFRSGFVGVDIFFVISGYLMTKIILGGIQKNNFSIIDFYNRRLVRIFPALLVLLLILFFAVYFFIPTQFISFLQSAFSSSLFFSNIYYYLNNGYFSADSHNNFLLHTWSLSVEWQFYMVYPIILVILKNIYFKNIKLFKLIFLLLIGISFLSMMYHNVSDYSYSFYIFYTRAWEMLVGGLAVFYAKDLGRISKAIQLFIVVASYMVLGMCLIFFKSEFWPSYLSIIPVLITVIILGFNVNFSILKNKKLKYIGDISYSLYLYHWPVYVFSKFFGLSTGIFNTSILIGISVILAVLSYELVEKKSLFKNTKYILITTSLIFISTLSLSFVNAENYLKDAGKLAAVTTYYKNKSAPAQYNFLNGHFQGEREFKTYDKNNLIVDERRKNVVLLGDSHAGMFSATFNNILEKKNINYIQLTTDATYPMIDAKGVYRGPKDFFNFVFKDFLIKNREKINLVVISSNYAAYDKSDVDQMTNFTDLYFEKSKIKYIYLGQTQNYPVEFPTYFYMKNKYKVSYPGEQELFKKTQTINKFLINKLRDRYINLLDYKINIVSVSNYPYIYDTGHLTFYGTELYKHLVAEKINSAINNKYHK